MELLAPAGDLEKLKIAVDYGADAVYFGGEMFSLRAGAGNLTIDEIKEGVQYAHDRGVRCHMTLNIIAHNDDLLPLREYVEQIKDIPIDAYIVSDPSVIMVIKEIIPNAVIHLSTQANTTNYMTASMWYQFGVSRIVLARELTLEEIQQIRDNLRVFLDIIYNENPAPFQIIGRIRLRFGSLCPFLHRRCNHRNGNREGGAFVFPALGFNPPSHGADDMEGGSQTDTASAEPACRAVVLLDKCLENLRQKVLFHSDPGV